MPEQDNTAKAGDGGNNSGNRQMGNKDQIYQMRKELKAEIMGLKKQVLQIQMQSLKIMQQSVQALFNTQVAETEQLVAIQNREMKQQAEELRIATKKEEEISNSILEAEKNNNPAEQLNIQYDASLRAMEIARKSVDDAIHAANKSIEEAEQVVKRIDGKPIKNKKKLPVKSKKKPVKSNKRIRK